MLTTAHNDNNPWLHLHLTPWHQVTMCYFASGPQRDVQSLNACDSLHAPHDRVHTLSPLCQDWVSTPLCSSIVGAHRLRVWAKYDSIRQCMCVCVCVFLHQRGVEMLVQIIAVSHFTVGRTQTHTCIFTHASLTSSAPLLLVSSWGVTVETGLLLCTHTHTHTYGQNNKIKKIK